MGKPHPIELRVRVVAFVEEGNSHREAARHFRVSPRFINNMMILHRTSGSLAPARQGHAPSGGKLAAHGKWIAERVADNGEVTLDELCVELAGRGVLVHRATVSRFLNRLGLSIKKSLRASEQLRPEIASARELWIERRRRFFNKALAQLVFIDETSTNTKLTKRTGWAPKGQRYRTHAPFGQWRTQTFIAGLRCHGLTAPWIVNAPMNRRIFETWVQTQLAPTLSRGDVVILDNVGFHKSDRADQLVKAKGAWLLFLPAYSPDLNPIEMAFSKLKALLRKRAARSFDAITQALGDIVSLFSVTECRNFFKAAGYEAE
ncbi:IS630 family transposase [Rhizobium ruizarguesonis]|uniref:IS630 family transposase n=2 Tax=Rhizobium TaxID=379 RepID=UPI00103074E7|nr:IS630 family transposase [Rhizobium ruizarguesonis]TBC88685.1 IS630 family transposase [Rhizobium ruizarguesonis]TBD07735.1 IS630 family transposase [Rhizobium ruizarguesonis]TBD24666.1 IS630 family transposase [Rhizobium ruizarguesonis]TBD24912.1 IS630 family transposase [Rhizobium ruizarguesonis]TBD34895.1 IS630 family transposase [Rhizobium ruizarguesonis]